MKLQLVDEDNGNRIVAEPYLVQMPGWSWGRYLREAPEMRFCEYVEGELIMHSPVELEHQHVVRFLTCLLQLYCVKHRLGCVANGPAVIKVASEKGREPDIFVIPPDQLGKARSIPLEIVPSLIIEVLSPGTRSLDLEVKPGEYESLGVGEYWVVDRERKVVMVHRLTDGYRPEACSGGRLDSSEIGGFRILVDWLWQEPLPGEPDCLSEIEG